MEGITLPRWKPFNLGPEYLSDKWNGVLIRVSRLTYTVFLCCCLYQLIGRCDAEWYQYGSTTVAYAIALEAWRPDICRQMTK